MWLGSPLEMAICVWEHHRGISIAILARWYTPIFAGLFPMFVSFMHQCLMIQWASTSNLQHRNPANHLVERDDEVIGTLLVWNSRPSIFPSILPFRSRKSRLRKSRWNGSRRVFGTSSAPLRNCGHSSMPCWCCTRWRWSDGHGRLLWKVHEETERWRTELKKWKEIDHAKLLDHAKFLGRELSRMALVQLREWF